MAAVKRRQLEVASRRVVQDAKLAIRDVYDAIVELVTNSDDRYQILGTSGRVEIELGRRGRGQPSILRVRDFADGMTTEQMNRKLGRIGGRVSGMEEGKAVRGTNSRGAKDIAALGKVTFESIAGDGRMHTCRIFPNMEYEADNSRKVTPAVQKRLGIGEGTGTVVTIEIDPSHRIPKIDTLVPNVARLVRLRDIVWQEQITLVPILDPSRKSGLIPDHAFVAALYERALTVETQTTRKRLDALERAANQFMEDYSDEETSRDPKRKERGSQFQIRGYSLSSPWIKPHEHRERRGAGLARRDER